MGMEIVLKGQLLQPTAVMFITIGQQPVPAKYAMRLLRLIKNVNEESRLYGIAKNKLLERYGEKDPDAPAGVVQYRFADEEREQVFLREFEDLNNEDVPLGMERLPWKIFEDMQLSAAHMEVLANLVVEFHPDYDGPPIDED